MNSATTQTQGIAMFKQFRLQRGLAFGVIIITALLAFELFNYSTTDFALSDLLGELQFFGVRWATILAIAFCGIDFAGIARLFTPEEGSNEPNEVWYLFGAWLLAATMNAMLTWWGVSLAILGNHTLGNAVIEREMLLRIVPIFVAILVWLIRVLIIGTFSVAGDRLFSQADLREPTQSRYYTKTKKNGSVPSYNNRSKAPRTATASSRLKPAPKPSRKSEIGYAQSEPTYHPISMSASAGPARTNSSAHESPFPRPSKNMRR